MKVRIVALGQRMPAWVATGYADYAKRITPPFAPELVEIKAAARDRGTSVARMLGEEAARIVAACAGYRIVALDERGERWSTSELAKRLARWRDAGDDPAFVIGSADGLDASVKTSASFVLSLSAMTLPHALCRILLAEQIYRAQSLLAGHPYHRA
jgi:23S rRNA (pseudouridine1915-N3)-methyltransferase